MGYQWISDKGSTVGFAGTCTGHHACYPNMGLPVDVPSIISNYIPSFIGAVPTMLIPQKIMVKIVLFLDAFGKMMVKNWQSRLDRLRMGPKARENRR